MHRSSMSPRAGVTLLELVVVCGIIALLAAIGIPRAVTMLDRINVFGAARATATVFATARMAAIARSSYVTVRLDVPSATVSALVGSDTIVSRRLGDQYGVRIAATRDSMAYNSVGLGYGAANLSVVIQRGKAADSVITSRLGRIRF